MLGRKILVGASLSLAVMGGGVGLATRRSPPLRPAKCNLRRFPGP
jgi:hypothetical protein